MRQETYGMTIETDLSIEEAEHRLRTALASEGFGILTEIDVQSTLRVKLDVERPPYKILGACNPALANEALQIDERVGLLLPCNVIIDESTPGRALVSVLDPDIMVAVSANDRLQEVAGEARERLLRALASFVDG